MPDAAGRRSPIASRRSCGIIETARGKRAKFRDARINMAHGAGGKATQSLIEGLLAPAFASEALDELADAGARARSTALELALTTDSYVVKPLRFPGGSIGELAVNGTVNDLAVSGARPLALSLSLILEEGLPAEDLRAEVEAIARGRAGGRGRRSSPATPRSSSAATPTGCTSARPASGRRDPRARLSPGGAAPGRPILLSGSIGEHGTAIMLARGEFELDAEIESDTRSLWPVVDALLEAAGPELRCLRDATRGGVASVLNELARASSVAMIVREGAVPVRPEVAGAAEILGIDPMYVANEGKLVAFVAPEAADAALAALRAVPGCEAAAEIGEVRTEPPGMVLVETSFGGQAGDGSAGRRPAAADLLSERGDGMATQASPYAKQKETEAVTAHVLWMTTGSELRGRLRGDDLGDQPEPRGHHPAGDPGHAQGRRPQPGRRLRRRPGVRAGLVRRRERRARPVRARDRGLARQRGDQRRGPLDRFRRQPGERPADHDERVDGPARAQGRRGGRGGHVRHLRRHPRDEEQPHRRDGRPRLSGLELEVQGRAARRVHPGLSRRSPTT